MLIAASLGADTTVALGDMLASLDRGHLSLILAAVAHAGGGNQHSRLEESPDGSMNLVGEETLHPWPAGGASAAGAQVRSGHRRGR